MNKKINTSINFLLAEYKRLKLKKEKKLISKEEQETLNKITSFLGKKNE